MSLQTTNLEPKQPSEIVTYKFKLSKNSAMADETLLSVAWTIYKNSDSTDTTATMYVGGGVDNTNKIVYVQIQGGTTTVQYVARGLVTCTSGNIYEVQGIFLVKEI